VFGFLGPNGAGKTTTIRILMGLIRASGGSAHILGQPVPSRAARARLGFLPESPYFYDYLTVAEVLDLAGRLFGLTRQERGKRADQLIELVGLERARDTPLKKYSKGMLQRAGIAQALVNDPDLVVLDEPMSGLDPIGRREVRDIIESLREQGKTVFFSSHILADVELSCDRAGILVKGRMRDVGALDELIDQRVRRTEIGFRVSEDLSEQALAELSAPAERVRHRGLEYRVELGAERDIEEYLAVMRRLGVKLVSVIPQHETLEDLFIRLAGTKDEAKDEAQAEDEAQAKDAAERAPARPAQEEAR
jgi:ABC-2 type transport system ATP-binding protein